MLWVPRTLLTFTDNAGAEGHSDDSSAGAEGHSDNAGAAEKLCFSNSFSCMPSSSCCLNNCNSVSSRNFSARSFRKLGTLF